MTPKTKPQRADICIIGAGASGATAAKALSEAGMSVVGLERGPWRTRETFGGDELANMTAFSGASDKRRDLVCDLLVLAEQVRELFQVSH